MLLVFALFHSIPVSTTEPDTATMYLAITILSITSALALPNTPCYTSHSIATISIPLITLHETAFHPASSSIAIPATTASLPPSTSTIDGHPIFNATACTPGTAECHFMLDKFRWCNKQGFWVGNYCGDEQVCCDKGVWGPECARREACGVPSDGRSKSRDVGDGAEGTLGEGDAWW
ncbi:uncharacterized protein M421DRAFT_125943 [Didymella exigua CBS 183.55]|uniref:Carbohydrate-binding module family 18 protein n=1 Tax=Didymella exigua CBS 183.55 TaxID=1150837 RepID=A0A6A5RWK7_9PLEO|nr:uncharacterized protein M421DRAFT_125943 [Didymella exigua CBS 183.55]KAF1929647.1 hypothetical protein M421DRAFT_125943 [Didymella exigua CBS 183.55]